MIQPHRGVRARLLTTAAVAALALTGCAGTDRGQADGSTECDQA